MTQVDADFCDCCTFGNHTSRCVCPDRVTKNCCHPQNHFRSHAPDRKALPELVGSYEASILLRVSAPRMWILMQRDDFPVPVARLKCGPVWLAEEIRAFQAARPKTSGRPRRSTA